ncbi:MAG TPA: ATP-binding protein [Steroidobacteraceae bacterium]|nr:ATP-binding protein [Steroidobacteraceae bacterium]
MNAARSEILLAEEPGALPVDALPADTMTPEAGFLRDASPLIEQELFRQRFVHWRLGLAAMACITWMIAGMYRYLDPDVATLRWALLETLAFAVAGLMCVIYEHRAPAAAGSAAQRHWMLGWTFAASFASALAGLLPWFLPASSGHSQLSAAALVSMLMMVFVVLPANRALLAASVGAYALTLSLSLALHADMLWAIPVCLVFIAMLLGMDLLLNVPLRQAIGDQLYARHLHRELRRSHAWQLAVRQREAALGERQRMMSDLHDGFGAQLLGALRRLEGGSIGVDGAAAMLRECIDDLRLTVDASEPAARSLAMLLAMLRHRMQPYMLAAGLQVNWRIEELPDASVFPAAHALDLLRILQQGITNVLQHAAARSIDIVARRLPRQIELAVEDDGKGLDPALAARNGRGIASMQRRAARLDAELLLEAREGGGTALRLRLRWPPAGEA